MICFTSAARNEGYISDTARFPGSRIWRSLMAAIVRVFARALPKESIEIEILKQLALFCGAGLLVSLLMMTYGLDLSPGLF